MPSTVFLTGNTDEIKPALACFVLDLLPGGNCSLLSAVSVWGERGGRVVQSAVGAGWTAQEPRLGGLHKASGRQSF